MKLLRVLLLVLITLIPFNLPAQQQSIQSGFEDAVLLQQLGEGNHGNQNEGTHENRNEAMLSIQQDVMNALQAKITNPEINNYVGIQQTGAHHTATVNQTGYKNAMEIIQKGNENFYGGNLDGNYNLISVLQQGHLNVVRQDLWGDNMELQVTQKGYHNELSQFDNSGTAPAYRVEQHGKGMKLIIENSVVMPGTE
ncbi:MAG TPA: hypothetical protein VE912_10125 [Bacteroidales bacterium]|nr:hypothetical protein [Bacteroidales bacterium]